MESLQRVKVIRVRVRIVCAAVCLLLALSGCATSNGIHRAARAGDIKKMQDYLNQGEDVNPKDKVGMTPLMSAADGGHTEAVKFLIDKGADVNAKSDVWIMSGGVTGGGTGIVTLEGDMTSLMFAARGGHTEIVKLLIDKGANINAKSKDGMTPLMYAAGGGGTEAVKFLIDKGADINAKANNGSTLLMHAAEGGSTEIVNLFIDKGADVSAKDAKGNSVLMYAIPASVFPSDLQSFIVGWGVVLRSANPAVVAKLIEKGADVNTKANDGTTALMLATGRENTETAQLLIEKGADVNAKADDGTTALMLALFYNNTALSNSLRQKGATIPCNTLITGFPGALNVYVDDEKKPALTCFRDLSNGSHTLRIFFEQHSATLSVNAKGNIYIVRYDFRNLKVGVDEISCDYGLTVKAETGQQSEPSSPKDYFSRGLDYAKKGQYGKAIEDFTKAIELDPKYGKAYMNRGVAHAKSGNSDKAGADFAQCCNIGFNKGCEASMQFIMGKPLNFTE